MFVDIYQQFRLLFYNSKILLQYVSAHWKGLKPAGGGVTNETYFVKYT